MRWHAPLLTLLAATAGVAGCGETLSITPQAVAQLVPLSACQLAADQTYQVDARTDAGWLPAAKVRFGALGPTGAQRCGVVMLDVEAAYQADQAWSQVVFEQIAQIGQMQAYQAPDSLALLTTQVPATDEELGQLMETLPDPASRDEAMAPQRAVLLKRVGNGSLVALDRCEGTSAADWTERVLPTLAARGLVQLARPDAPPPRGSCGVIATQQQLESLVAAGLPDGASLRLRPLEPEVR